MNWTLAIDRNQRILVRLVAALMVLAGMSDGNTPKTLPRATALNILRLLRPSESALRRLIAIADYVLPVVERASRAVRKTKGTKRARSTKARKRAPAFALLDPRKRLGPPNHRRRAKGAGPRLWFLDDRDPVFESDGGAVLSETVDAARLHRRLLAMMNALQDLPKQVERLRRLRARQKASKKPVKRVMRPGRPPGHRARGTHYIDAVLKECQTLALRVAAADTS